MGANSDVGNAATHRVDDGCGGDRRCTGLGGRGRDGDSRRRFTIPEQRCLTRRERRPATACRQFACVSAVCGRSQAWRVAAKRSPARDSLTSERSAVVILHKTLSNSQQSFGENPVQTRETRNYKKEYVKSFVEKWDELIDWKSRAESEGDFFIEKLKEHEAREVLDVATGTGFHSVRLLEAGFGVVSADGSAEMLAMAFNNGKQYGHILRTVQADWRWLNRDVHGEYDAIICLGNSFTHLFSERDRRKALAEYYAMLKHDGILIMDQRNYDRILDDGFSSKHTYYYCGEDVVAKPEHVDEGLARFRYEFPDNSEFHLNMFPLRKAYTRRLLHEVGFQRIETYGDFQETYHDDEPDFFVHVAEKTYREDEEEFVA